jgi:hypothetical protein
MIQSVPRSMAALFVMTILFIIAGLMATPGLVEGEASPLALIPAILCVLFAIAIEWDKILVDRHRKFRVGDKVYSEVNFPGRTGKVLSLCEPKGIWPARLRVEIRYGGSIAEMTLNPEWVRPSCHE